MTTFGHFEDDSRSYVIDNPLTPHPWINYLGNRSLRAFVSQNAGGLLWLKQPYSGRLTRYQYTASPQDSPGFYFYVKDARDHVLWSPSAAPTHTPLNRFACRHAPGITSFQAERNGLEAKLDLCIPPHEDVFLWHFSLRNLTQDTLCLRAATYLEFGLLEFLREALAWCYLKNHFALHYDPSIQAIRYDYHVFEAPYAPRMLFGATEPPDAYTCSRDLFIGRTGTLAAPAWLTPETTPPAHDLPEGGHACATLAFDLRLAPGQEKRIGICFSVAETWAQAEKMLQTYQQLPTIEEAFAQTRMVWNRSLSRTLIQSNDPVVDRAINTWLPYNAIVALDLARTISTEHTGMDGLRYRDTTQDALAVAHLDPPFARERMELVLSQQCNNGAGCFAFYPDDRRPPSDTPQRCDNTVWTVETLYHIIAESGDIDWLHTPLPYRDGGEASIYEHMLQGLRYIAERRGPRKLPILYHADWNDGLALFQDEQAESIMLGMQMVHALKRFSEIALFMGYRDDADWSLQLADELTQTLNRSEVWDGSWYRRLLLSNGTVLGSAHSPEGHCYLTPQAWSVISGVGEYKERGRVAMLAVAERLNTPCGICILAPPYTGIPTPQDPPLGSNPGIGENGGIFLHANTWAIMAEAMLGNAEQAYTYFRQILPEVLSHYSGQEHYRKEPYALVSSLAGPASASFGAGGIGWLTGTANWLYHACTQYIFGVRATLHGLEIRPCLPKCLTNLTIERQFRDSRYHIQIDNTGSGAFTISVDGYHHQGGALPYESGQQYAVKVVRQ